MYYSVGAATYWYEVHGKGEPIVLLHGFTGSSRTWDQFVSDFQKDLQIITVDLPGHGKTHAPVPRSMEACCNDLNQLFTYLKLESFHLLGYSMGGRTAITFAMLYPKKVQSLSLESASPGLATEKEREERKEKDENLAVRLENKGIEQFVDFWENIPLFHTQKKLPDEKKAAIREERLAQNKDGLAQSLRSMGTGSQPSWWDKLADTSLPVLLLAGVLDNKFTGINKKMLEYLPNSDLKIIADAGHAIHVEQPVVFGRIVKEFIFKNRYI